LRLGQALPVGGNWGECRMETVQPDDTDPAPLRAPPPHVGSIIVRFVGLLLASMTALALLWSR